MVLFSLLELTAQAGIFVVKKTWHVGVYLIWGHQKTREELLEEKLEKQIERENELMAKLNNLQELRAPIVSGTTVSKRNSI